MTDQRGFSEARGIRESTKEEQRYWIDRNKFAPLFKFDYRMIERNKYAPWGRGEHQSRKIK